YPPAGGGTPVRTGPRGAGNDAPDGRPVLLAAASASGRRAARRHGGRGIPRVVCAGACRGPRADVLRNHFDGCRQNPHVLHGSGRSAPYRLVRPGGGRTADARPVPGLTKARPGWHALAGDDTPGTKAV